MLLAVVIGKAEATIEHVKEPSEAAVRPIVVMYSRRTCGLCDEAREVVQAERRRSLFNFQEVFIDGDDALEREYGLRVPVVAIDGREEFEYRIEPSRFHGLLTR